VNKLNIAIDGPAGAGKSTVAKRVADTLEYVYVDTGAMYRALTWQALEAGKDVQNEEALVHLLRNMDLQMIPSSPKQQVIVNGINVTEDIRRPDVTKNVSFVASHGKIRSEMVKLQQQLADQSGVVMDGRDIGTHVLPDAEVKIFLSASLDERARRRYTEQKRNGTGQSLEEIKRDIRLRDERDSNRDHAPLKKAEDAVDVDTTGLDVEEVVQKILDIVTTKHAALKEN
jgi:CMP/dCMP kinase